MFTVSRADDTPDTIGRKPSRQDSKYWVNFNPLNANTFGGAIIPTALKQQAGNALFLLTEGVVPTPAAGAAVCRLSLLPVLVMRRTSNWPCPLENTAHPQSAQKFVRALDD